MMPAFSLARLPRIEFGAGTVKNLPALAAGYGRSFLLVTGATSLDQSRINIDVMLAREPDNPALEKYARVAELLCRQLFSTPEQAWKALLELLDDWTQRLQLPTLDAYGITPADFDHVVAHARGSRMKTNPVVLSDAEIAAVLEQRCSKGAGITR